MSRLIDQFIRKIHEVRRFFMILRNTIEWWMVVDADDVLKYYYAMTFFYILKSHDAILDRESLDVWATQKVKSYHDYVRALFGRDTYFS